MTAATATRTRATECVVINAEGHEVKRYAWRDSARRRAGKIPGARVLTVAEWEAENAAGPLDPTQADVTAALEAEAEDAMTAAVEEDAPAEELAEIEAERAENEERADAAYGRYVTRRGFAETVYRATQAGARAAEPTEEEVTAALVADNAAELVAEGGAPAPEKPARKRALTNEERRAEYAARMENGPAVYALRDGEYVYVRRYECDRRAARAARGMATRQGRPQVPARVITADGAVLLDTETDPVVAEARETGEHLSGLRPV